jgi:hypothetical protein
LQHAVELARKVNRLVMRSPACFIRSLNYPLRTEKLWKILFWAQKGRFGVESSLWLEIGAQRRHYNLQFFHSF